MPVLNDVTHVEAAVDSLLAQDFDGPIDVAIAVGPSIDGTTDLVNAMAERDARIRVIENPVGSTPAGLNIAIAATTHPIVVRVDAHSVLPREYTRIAVETIRRTGAANVGGIMDAQGTTRFESAVATAYGSRVGLGGTPHHVGGEEGPADTVYLGVFRRAPLVAAGMFDERIKRGQDWELNKRLRDAGEVVWFTPELRVTYRPRPSLGRLARQFLFTGLWRGELSRAFPSRRGLRYAVPPAMVVSVIAGVVLGVWGSVWGPEAPAVLHWAWAVPGVYAAFVVVAALVVPNGGGVRERAWLLIVLPTIHVCWGIGFLLGYVSLARGISALRNGREPTRP
ncbi:glycosyltransferase family 2 protein [Mycetocola reblochoni]|nr:glycosyltransferase family 2 protein [Mycetocola reblochoni]